MPTYSYKCKDCEHTYSAFQSIKDEPDKKCPECGGAIVRLIGAGSGILFKGSGFYVTDYRKDSKEKKDSQGKSNEPAKKEGSNTTNTPKSPTTNSTPTSSSSQNT